MDKVIVNYESSTGVVHDGGLETQWNGLTRCGIEFSIHNRREYKWYATNRDVTCKNCAPPQKMVFTLDENISIFGIDTDEKARLATIRARLLSAMETWSKHASGKIDKEQFDLDMRHDLRDTVTDLHEYRNLYRTKRWSHEKKRYVTVDRSNTVNKIRHSLDGKVPK